MVFNKLLRKGTMLILAVTIFAVFGLSATANCYNPDQRLINNWGFSIFPHGSIASQFEIFSYSTGQPNPINELTTEAAFQQIGEDGSIIVPWRFIVPQQFGAINIIAPPFGGQIMAVPPAPMIYKANGGRERFLPITGEPNALLTGYGRISSARIGSIRVPVIRVVPVEATIKPRPIIKVRTEEITKVAVISEIVKGIPSVPPSQPIASDIAAVPIVITPGGEIEKTIKISEIGGDVSSPPGDESIPGDINEDYSDCLSPNIFLRSQENDIQDGCPAETRSRIKQPIAGSTRVEEIRFAPIDDRKKIGGPPADTSVIPKDIPKDQPAIPLNSAGDKSILNSVPHSEQGKACHKTQHKITEVSFALNLPTQNSPITNDGGTYDLQRCSAQPRAPTDNERNV